MRIPSQEDSRLGWSISVGLCLIAFVVQIMRNVLFSQMKRAVAMRSAGVVLTISQERLTTIAPPTISMIEICALSITAFALLGTIGLGVRTRGWLGVPSWRRVLLCALSVVVLLLAGIL